MKFNNVFFINGTAYAGKSTIVKMLAEKHNGIACEENYHDSLSAELNKEDFPCLTYTRDLQNWSDFIRRTPEEYEAWIDGCTKECTALELKILEKLAEENKKIFVDTNIPISVTRFFDRPDKEKQFLYQLLLKEDDPERAIDNFREGLKRVNSKERYDEFLNSGFSVLLLDENRTVEETLELAERVFKLD